VLLCSWQKGHHSVKKSPANKIGRVNKITSNSKCSASESGLNARNYGAI